MSSGYTEIDSEDFTKILSYVGNDYKEFATHIFENKVCTVSSLMDTFEASSKEILEAVGSVNGRIFKKFHCCVYPLEVNATVVDSVYSIGRMS